MNDVLQEGDQFADEETIVSALDMHDKISGEFVIHKATGTKGAHGGHLVHAGKSKGPVNPGDYILTRELAYAHADADGYIVVTWANHHYLDFVRTWHSLITKHQVTNYLVGAMDRDLFHVLVNEGISCWWMGTSIGGEDLGWGSKRFREMGAAKVKLIYDFTAMGLNVVVSDIDALWLRNPIPFFAKFPHVDVLISSDHVRPTVITEELEQFTAVYSSLNIGIILIRPSGIHFTQAWLDDVLRRNVWDQQSFNELARKDLKPVQGSTSLARIHNDTLTLGVLPVAYFCNGHTYFIQRAPERLHIEPYAVHATFQYSGTPGKKHRLREQGLFVDPPEYYSANDRYISFDLDVSEKLLIESVPGDVKGQMTSLAEVAGHFSLINHQLTQVRNALAVASILNRTLIMPPLHCGIDKYWAPLEGGRAPGTQFPLPFQCPMDHVFELEGAWTKSLDPNVYGAPIRFREHSFLKNPRLTWSVVQNKVHIETCRGSGVHCNSGDKPAELQAGAVLLMEQQTDEQLRTALSSMEYIRLLHFSAGSMTNIFRNFTNPELWTRFENRMKIYTSNMGTLHEQPGWVQYDMLWDLPHQDRFGRYFESWTPRIGEH